MPSGLIYTNGTLTKITATGTSADFDVPATAGADRWTGSLGITVRERHVEQIAGGNLDQIDQTHVILPYTQGLLVQRGDTLAFTYEGNPEVRKAGTIVRSQLAGRVRVDLEDA